jgi:TolB protein
MTKRLKLAGLGSGALVCLVVWVALIGLAGGRQSVWAQAGPQSSGSPTGSIAYVTEDGRQIRLVEPDGSSDRLVWQTPANTVYGISSVAWRPDAAQLAFTSGHEALCSLWHSDVYVINPDGSGLRRVTNAPACAQLGGNATGNVTVRIENYISNMNQFLVYFEGMTTAYPLTLEPGFAVDVTFSGVADLGANVLQQPVVINASQRWMNPAVYADVVAGKTANIATPLQISASGTYEQWGASAAAWSPDQTQIGFILGVGALWRTAVNPPSLSNGQNLLDPAVSVLANNLAWHPTTNQILYEEYGSFPPGINLATVGGATAGARLVDTTLTSGISWLPDGSGFLYTDHNAWLSESNIYWYDFSGRASAGGNVAQITFLADEYASAPAISPDMNQIVFTHASQYGSGVPLDIQIIDSNGSNPRPLANGGGASTWSRQDVPTSSGTKLHLPFVLR